MRYLMEIEKDVQKQNMLPIHVFSQFLFDMLCQFTKEERMILGITQGFFESSHTIKI